MLRRKVRANKMGEGKTWTKNGKREKIKGWERERGTDIERRNRKKKKQWKGRANPRNPDWICLESPNGECGLYEAPTFFSSAPSSESTLKASLKNMDNIIINMILYQKICSCGTCTIFCRLFFSLHVRLNAIFQSDFMGTNIVNHNLKAKLVFDLESSSVSAQQNSYMLL